MRIIKRLLIVALVLSITIGTNVSMAHASDSQKDAQPSDVDAIKLAIDSINDPVIKEKLLDLNSIEYLEFIVDEKNALLNDKAAITDRIETEINYSREMALNEIKKLSKLDKNQLDAEIKNKMQELIDMKKERTDIIILPSSYEILEKYSFHKEVDELKNMEQKAVVSSDGSTSSLRAYDGWEKYFTGYLRNGGGGIAASYTLTVQWYINSSSEIYFWDLYHGGSSASSLYKFVSYNVNEDYLYNSSTVLCVESQAKYKKTFPILPPGTPPYNLILISAECTNTGGFSAWSWTEAIY